MPKILESTVVQLNGDLGSFMRMTGDLQVATSQRWGSNVDKEIKTLSSSKRRLCSNVRPQFMHEGKEYILLSNAGGPGRNNGLFT